ncbi:MAG: CarD family transcriptional regulator [Deltaproteobacteria bacterium]|nr:CarD family transcriptional regulator [Deltaproteobacteria bacterium]MBW2072673.1 CarD family transcriptional regulator [Deltaproteobacteria bacterium]
MFKVGDLAVYPAHGVGIVEAIESKTISGTRQDFYILRILENDMIIMIPVNNVDSVGLRQVIDVGEVPKVFEILKEKEVTIDNQTWNRRYREYMDKIKTGSLFDLAEVMRDLCMLREDKELSFGERKMLDTARSLLVKEISIAKQADERQVEKDILEIFGD